MNAMQFFNFQWRISKKEQEVPRKETNTQVKKLWAYTDSEVPREYPDLKNNHTPKRNPDQETKNQANKESPSFHTGKARSLALLTEGKSESLSTYTEVSLCGREKGARFR